MLEAHLVSVKELVRPAIVCFDITVVLEVAVFAISHDWMANRCEVGADLVRSACEKLHFNKREAHHGFEGFVFGYCGFAAFFERENGYKTSI